MKNKIGKIGGFLVGLTGLLLIFKVIFLPLIPPEDELAPGIVVIIAILNGFLFAFVGNFLQNYFERKQQVEKIH